MRYRVRRRIRRAGEPDWLAGSVISEEVAREQRRFTLLVQNGWLEPEPDSEPEGEAEAEPQPEPEVEAEPETATVAEIREALPGLTLTEARELRETEAAGRARQTALAAIDARIHELEGEETEA